MADAETVASVNGARTVLLQIRKQSGTNTVEVVNGVKERLDELQAGAAGRLRRCASCATSREFIEASIRNVEEHLVVGSILAALVVLLFLGEPALDDHRGDRDPDVDHRDVRRSSGTWASRST